MAIDRGTSDAAILKELGDRLARRRLRENLTQAKLAHEAGISKRTLIRLESGESSQLANLIRVLRAKPKERRRASPASKRRTPPRSDWTWGDEPPR